MKLSKRRKLTALILFCALAISGAAFWNCLPDELFDDPYSTVILDRNGELLGASIAQDEQWRFPPDYAVPDKFVQAITAYEDKRFFQHHGVDPIAVIRAVGLLAAKQRVVSGASTITMQVLRLSRKGRPRTVREKLIEMIMALRLELGVDKEKILGLYASHAPFGGNVVGLSAASWRYYGRSPDRLSWSETATMAVLPNNPALVHPGRNRDRLLEKRNFLLDRLNQRGVIDEMTCKLGKAEPLTPRPRPIPLSAPHLLQRVKNSLARSGGKNSSNIKTTLDGNLQIRAARVLEQHSKELAGNEIHNAAALILEVGTGRVLAYAGNVPSLDGENHGNQVDVIPAPRSTGSILKPFLFAGMVQSGELLPSQLVNDTPSRFQGFAPENYTRTFNGAVPAYMALARSLNIPAVRMLQSYGVDRFYGLSKRLGMTTLNRPADDYGLSLILGGAEGSLWDVTGIYAGMARTVNRAAMGASPDEAAFFPPSYLMEREQADPSISRNSNEPPLAAPACWLTFQALLNVARPGGYGAWKDFSSSEKIAWKTGTSYGFRDAWAVGVTPEYAVGVWVGNADGEGRPELTGSKAAAPIMFDLFSLLDSGKWFSRPEAGLYEISVCAKSGFRPGPDCTQTRIQAVPKAGLRTPACPYCRTIHLDPQQKWQVHSGCERVADMASVKRFVLPGVMEHYYMQNHSDYAPLPKYREDCLSDPADQPVSPLSVLYPVNNCQIYVPVELDGKPGRTVFQAAHRIQQAVVYWHMNGEFIGSTRDFHQMAMTPEPGNHVLTLVDQDGETVERKFEILAKK